MSYSKIKLFHFYLTCHKNTIYHLSISYLFYVHSLILLIFLTIYHKNNYKIFILSILIYLLMVIFLIILLDYPLDQAIFLLLFLVINQITIKHLYMLNSNQILIFQFSNLQSQILGLIQVILKYIINGFLLQIQNYILNVHNLLQHLFFSLIKVLEKNVVYDFFLIILMKLNRISWLLFHMKSLTFFMDQ